MRLRRQTSTHSLGSRQGTCIFSWQWEPLGGSEQFWGGDLGFAVCGPFLAGHRGVWCPRGGGAGRQPGSLSPLPPPGPLTANLSEIRCRVSVASSDSAWNCCGQVSFLEIKSHTKCIRGSSYLQPWKPEGPLGTGRRYSSLEMCWEFGSLDST